MSQVAVGARAPRDHHRGRSGEGRRPQHPGASALDRADRDHDDREMAGVFVLVSDILSYRVLAHSPEVVRVQIDHPGGHTFQLTGCVRYRSELRGWCSRGDLFRFSA